MSARNEPSLLSRSLPYFAVLLGFLCVAQFLDHRKLLVRSRRNEANAAAEQALVADKQRQLEQEVVAQRQRIAELQAKVREQAQQLELRDLRDKARVAAQQAVEAASAAAADTRSSRRRSRSSRTQDAADPLSSPY